MQFVEECAGNLGVTPSILKSIGNDPAVELYRRGLSRSCPILDDYVAQARKALTGNRGKNETKEKESRHASISRTATGLLLPSSLRS